MQSRTPLSPPPSPSCLPQWDWPIDIASNVQRIGRPQNDAAFAQWDTNNNKQSGQEAEAEAEAN